MEIIIHVLYCAVIQQHDQWLMIIILTNADRVVVVPHLAALMWLMIKADKWFTVLNCPLVVWCLLEGDILPLAPFTQGPRHTIFFSLSVDRDVRQSVCFWISKYKLIFYLKTKKYVNVWHLTYNILLSHHCHMLCTVVANVLAASPLGLSDQFQWEYFGAFPMSSDGSLCYQWDALSPVT